MQAMVNEDTFEMPAAWRRVVRRRRGGPQRTPVTVDDGASVRVAQWAEHGAARSVRSMNDPESDRQLAEELRAHLADQAAPRGAALYAQLLVATDGTGRATADDDAAFADA